MRQVAPIFAANVCTLFVESWQEEATALFFSNPAANAKAGLSPPSLFPLSLEAQTSFLYAGFALPSGFKGRGKKSVGAMQVTGVI